MSLDEWNPTKQCMSYIMDKNGKRRRCQLKTKMDFCSKHHETYDITTLKDIKKNTIKKTNINIKKINKEIQSILEEQKIKSYIYEISNTTELNEKYEHNLLNMYNSWDEIALSERINIDNEIWPVDILIKHITNQLNHANMENPYPIYPSNPFNRKLFTVSGLLILKKRLVALNKKISISLKFLLSQSEKILNIYYDEANSESTHLSISLLEMFKKQFRFMLLHEKNSQSSYIGMWVTKNFPLTTFEKCYKKFLNIPFQLIINNELHDNPHREIIQMEIDVMPFDKYDLFDDKFCDFL